MPIGPAAAGHIRPELGLVPTLSTLFPSPPQSFGCSASPAWAWSGSYGAAVAKRHGMVRRDESKTIIQGHPLRMALLLDGKRLNSRDARPSVVTVPGNCPNFRHFSIDIGESRKPERKKPRKRRKLDWHNVYARRHNRSCLSCFRNFVFSRSFLALRIQVTQHCCYSVHFSRQ